MNIEFHYYITAWLAAKAGFREDEAATIGIASQFVDQNLVTLDIDTQGRIVRLDPTQDYSFWDERVRDEIYLPFHFIPALSEAVGVPRLDGSRNRWSVACDSAPAREILVAALRTRDLHRIGIAVHAYADTWAHQNFSGLNERWNLIDDRLPLPPVGHAHALKQPDSLSLTWTDPRLAPGNSTVTNRTRFLQAAKKIYKYFRAYHKANLEDANATVERLETLLGRPGERHREERQLNLAIDAGFPPYDRNGLFREAGIADAAFGNERVMDGYDRLLWLKNGITRTLGLSRAHGISAGAAFRGSALERWIDAARGHRETARSILGLTGGT